MNPTANRRRFFLALAAIIATVPWMLFASQRTISSMFNAPLLWVPETLEYRQEFEWFRVAFRSEDTVLVSFPGCSIEDARLSEFGRVLMSPVDPGERSRNRELFQHVVTGRDLLEDLQREEMGLSRAAAMARLNGLFVGPDRKTSCAVITVTLHGVYERQNALEVIRKTASEVFEIPPERIVMGGPAVDGATIDAASMDSVFQLAPPATVLGVLLCLWCLRSWILTGIIFLVAVFGQGLVLGLTSVATDHMNAVLIVLPVLVYVLAISTGVHLSNYHRNATRSSALGDPTSRAIRQGFVPCMLATITTVIGLTSLSVSNMTPILVFSTLASVGVIVSVALLFLLLPCGMDIRWRRMCNSGAAPTSTESSRIRFFDFLGGWIAKGPGLITLAFLVLMTLMCVGLTRTETSVNIRSLFLKDSQILQDYDWLESQIGPLVPVEVIVRFDPSCELTALQRMELIRDTHQVIGRMEDVGGTLSAATFFPNIPAPGGLRRTARRSVLRRKLGTDAMERLQTAGFVARDAEFESWRISGRVSALQDIDYGHFLDQLRNTVDPFLDGRGDDGVSAIYSGNLSVTYEAQRALLDDLVRSYLTAFTIVAVIMVIVLRSFVAGVLVMLPNLFPTVLLFGSMGWLGVPVDIGSVMTASVALGIAVDDTLHFLGYFRYETSRGVDRATAVQSCFHHCGRAMVQTSLIITVGLLVYLRSDFAPTCRFSAMMIGLMCAALIGDLVLLPALLLGRFGRLFEPAGRRHPQSADVPVTAAPPR